MAHFKARLKAMTMEQFLFREQYEPETYQMLPYPDFATGFIEERFYKSQQFHCYNRLTENVTQTNLVIKSYSL